MQFIARKTDKQTHCYLKGKQDDKPTAINKQINEQWQPDFFLRSGQKPGIYHKKGDEYHSDEKDTWSNKCQNEGRYQ